jgi:hypothetical protein
VIARRVVIRSWNTQYATGKVNGYKRITTPFRAVNNSGDFLSRQYYTCGGPNPTNASRPGYKRLIGSIWSQCDATGVPASSCNVKFVADSSDYTRFRGLQAKNQTYNDLTSGGTLKNTQNSALMAVRH